MCVIVMNIPLPFLVNVRIMHKIIMYKSTDSGFDTHLTINLLFDRLRSNSARFYSDN